MPNTQERHDNAGEGRNAQGADGHSLGFKSQPPQKTAETARGTLKKAATIPRRYATTMDHETLTGLTLPVSCGPGGLYRARQTRAAECRAVSFTGGLGCGPALLFQMLPEGSVHRV